MRYLSVLFLAIILVSCQPKRSEIIIPKKILTQEFMVDILTDMQLVEGTLIYKRSTGKNYRTLRDYYYSHIFKKYNITQGKFEESLNFYKQHLKLLNNIYTEVIRKLEQYQKEEKYE